MKKLLSILLAVLVVVGNYLLFGFGEDQQTLTGGDGLTIHYIDVGQADSTLVECGGEFLLIDGGNRDDGDLVVTYLEEQGVQELKAVVCTHAHEDHVGGLPSVLAVYPTKAVYAPTNTYASRIFDDFLYYTDQQGLAVTIPSPGDRLTLGNAELTVLGPVKTYGDANNTSIVLRVEYGSTSFLFTGDMEKEAESDMLDYWDEQIAWQTDVLKVGHHGSDTSSGYRFLNEVMPTYGVIPVGTGNDYGHPHREPMERLDQAEVIIARTDKLGHIVAQSDGREVSLTWQNQSAQPEKAQPGDRVFIGNQNSKTLHTPHCKNLPGEKNRVEFRSYDEAIDQGYKPCTGCLG